MCDWCLFLMPHSHQPSLPPSSAPIALLHVLSALHVLSHISLLWHLYYFYIQLFKTCFYCGVMYVVKCTNLNVQLELYQSLCPCNHHTDEDLRHLQYPSRLPSPSLLTSKNHSILPSTVRDPKIRSFCPVSLTPI